MAHAVANLTNGSRRGNGYLGFQANHPVGDIAMSGNHTSSKAEGVTEGTEGRIGVAQVVLDPLSREP